MAGPLTLCVMRLTSHQLQVAKVQAINTKIGFVYNFMSKMQFFTQKTFQLLLGDVVI